MKKLASWEEVVKFHGHSCMGLATGYRVAEAALKALDNDRDIDEEIVAIVENDNCSIDAIQYVTGCTFGKGNLIFYDYGKPVYTFARRSNQKAVRIVAKGLDDNKYRELADLRQKISSGEFTAEEQERFKQLSSEAMQQLLSEPLDNVVDVLEITYNIPEKARIFKSITCNSCGEKVMEPRARVENGEIVCIPCAEAAGRNI